MKDHLEKQPDEHDLNNESIGGQWALVIVPAVLAVKTIIDVRDYLVEKYEKLTKTFKQ